MYTSRDWIRYVGSQLFKFREHWHLRLPNLTSVSEERTLNTYLGLALVVPHGGTFPRSKSHLLLESHLPLSFSLSFNL